MKPLLMRKGDHIKYIRIKHAYILDDPFDDPSQLVDLIPVNSPEQMPLVEGEEVRLEDDWIPMDEQQDPELLRSHCIGRKHNHGLLF
ncbi:hypothetical protein SUGI_0684160 [Cryptomeria japonica]|nr:hypothetical protein SUGI_0684160 [Cryptomeria japonica]